LVGWRLGSAVILLLVSETFVLFTFLEETLNSKSHHQSLFYPNLPILASDLKMEEACSSETSVIDLQPTNQPTYIHTYTHIHTYVHTYIRTYIHTYLHTYIHTYIHTYLRTYIHTYMHTYIHAYIHTCVHAYTHTHTPYRHTHMYTYVQVSCNTFKPAGYQITSVNCVMAPFVSTNK
jgi:hypothetical protein